jgi:hypothetical protein
MKFPRFVWVVARTFGLGAAAVYVAGTYAQDVEACAGCYVPTHGCYKTDYGAEGCYWTYTNGSWLCHLVNNCYSGS